MALYGLTIYMNQCLSWMHLASKCHDHDDEQAKVVTDNLVRKKTNHFAGCMSRLELFPSLTFLKMILL